MPDRTAGVKEPGIHTSWIWVAAPASRRTCPGRLPPFDFAVFVREMVEEHELKLDDHSLSRAFQPREQFLRHRFPEQSGLAVVVIAVEDDRAMDISNRIDRDGPVIGHAREAPVGSRRRVCLPLRPRHEFCRRLGPNRLFQFVRSEIRSFYLRCSRNFHLEVDILGFGDSVPLERNGMYSALLSVSGCEQHSSPRGMRLQHRPIARCA